jgi:hypothetical protein
MFLGILSSLDSFKSCPYFHNIFKIIYPRRIIYMKIKGQCDVPIIRIGVYLMLLNYL